MSVRAFWKVIAHLSLTIHMFWAQERVTRQSLDRVKSLLKPWVMLALANIKKYQWQCKKRAMEQLKLMWWGLCVCFRPHWPQPLCEASTKNHLHETRDRNMADWLGEGQQIDRDLETGTEERTKTDEKEQDLNMHWGVSWWLINQPWFLKWGRRTKPFTCTVKKGSCNLSQTHFLTGLDESN